MSAEQCRTGKNESLKEFALAYCFLLLFVSSHSSEPAKERMYFEYIYIFTKEIITTVLCLPSFAVTVGKELERLFRSGLFQGHQNLDQESGGVSDSRIAKLLGGGSRENIVKSKVGRAVKSAPPGKSRVLHSELSFGDPSPLPLANTGGHGTGDKGRFSIARRTSRPSTSRGRIGHASAAGPTFNAGRNILGDVIPTSGGWTKIEETALQEAFKSSPDEALGPDGMPKREGEDEPEAQSRPIRSAALRERERLRRRKVSINAVRMARSPLADFVLPPPQRFLFVQTRANVTGSLVGV
ncbi:hypothetical protein DFJ77DRAFT_446557 [Powellomyces hirtus]|nr:hypothetical protein DFJ77DRAFT_446557 [Powellomyces hirtus]